MQSNDRISRALNHLTRGGFHYSGGKIHHESFGMLPSVEHFAAAVKEHPGEIARALLDDALSESLPMELDAKTLQRAAVGAGTVEDVQRLTEARAVAAERVYDLGKRLIEEAEGISADTAARILYVAARAGYVLDEDGMLLPFGGDSSLPAVPVHPLVIAAGEKDPVGLTKAFARLCTEIGVLPKIPGDAFTLSRQLAGYFHSALVLGLDELKAAIGERQSARAAVERAAGLLLRLAKKGYCYKGRTIINIADTSEKLPETDFSLIDRTLAAFPCEVAALLAEELKDLPDEIGAAIDTGKATKEDVYELCGRLAMEATE